ncbi:putative extracellular serine carboxypeptidase 1 [Colletotrichum chlorophyti]|uniref:Putative extracellular serine carboxypeptidase 1 n=1 Tax=Colletotrichum chlorophyti TaxID=708187 RepID=A0A1Q8RUX8_9PEZI|nr:putative extracellular serine carboxypeptidase 1 [Colletotrichum chlorophyti]
MRASFVASALALAATAVAELLPPSFDMALPSAFKKIGGLEARAHSDPDNLHNGTFDQLLDHTDPSKGTFKQRYWYNAEHWGGPGYPIFMMNGGETNASQLTGYLENGTLTSLYAQTYKGAIILIEHRYYGESLPFKTFTAETLQYLSVPQAIYDNIYYAESVQLPFDSQGGANANKSPWVLIGGSYPGALAAWTSVIAPGTFAAYHASSAVVQAIEDFWQFFTPIEKALPRNCSADIKLVVNRVDEILDRGDVMEIAAMKQEFGLGQLVDHGDFAFYLRNPIIQWASNQSEVFRFCDWIETSANNGRVVEGCEQSGVGVAAAWEGYTSWVHATFNQTCSQGACALKNKSYNRPYDLGWERAWRWQLCNEPFGWWHVGPPESDGTNIVSSYLRPEHRQRECDLAFPQTSGHKPAISEGFTADFFNEWTGGWNATFENVLFADGEFDPWISATMSSEYRPGGPAESTEQTPRFVVKGGGHIPDFLLNGRDDNEEVINQEVEVIGKWIRNWKPRAS